MDNKITPTFPTNQDMTSEMQVTAKELIIQALEFYQAERGTSMLSADERALLADMLSEDV